MIGQRVLACVLLVALSPVLGVVAIVIRITIGAPVLFRHRRSGLNGKPFEVVKFRTMRTARYPAEPDDLRLTRVGRLLRAASLDELPNLWNVARGEMAFLGPRPLAAAYADLYDDRLAHRLSVRPGMTGLVQVQGRNTLTWEEKFELDLWYVEHRSWRLDLEILLRTPMAVVKGGNVAHPGYVTMPVFTFESSSAPGPEAESEAAEGPPTATGPGAPDR